MSEREIKFRVREAQTKAVIAYEYCSSDMGWMHSHIKHSANGEEYIDVIHTDTLCSGWVIPSIREQFTGRLDKNGEEIYEGDYVLNEDGKRWRVYWSGSWRAWAANDGRNSVMLSDLPWGIEVIGNIHENTDD